MLEMYFDKRGEIAAENMSDLLHAYPDYADRAMASAMRSQGFRLKNIIQDAIRAGGPKGHPWPKLNPHTGILGMAKRKTVKNWKMVWKGQKGRKRRVRQYKSSMTSKKASPLLKLRGAVRYIYDREAKQLHVGFVGNASSRLLSIVHSQAEGYDTPVTARMRKRMFALGFPLKKSTRTLRTPPRPLIRAVFEAEKGRIHKQVADKFMKNVLRYASEKAGKNL